MNYIYGDDPKRKPACDLNNPVIQQMKNDMFLKNSVIDAGDPFYAHTVQYPWKV